MIALLFSSWLSLALAVAVALGAIIAYRDRQVPTDDGPPECPGCSCSLCPDCETEDVR